MRKYISLLLGMALIALAFLAFKKLANSKKAKRHIPEKTVKKVITQSVKNRTIPIDITSSGVLKAKKRIDLFTEVQGIVTQTYKEFKPGVFFHKGETLLRINSDEFRANLQALKSNFFSVLTAMMPDLQLDFPDIYPKWKAYLANFDMHKPVPKLPEMTSEKEKYFITGRKVLSSYYNVKNAEVRLGKYRLKAPFSGVLSETFVNSGTLVRPGQRLGSFVNTEVFELPVNVNTQYMHLLEKGKKVTVFNNEYSKQWSGIISRINPVVDANSQSVKAYITLRGKDLHEGMYLEAKLPAKAVKNALEINRKLIVDDDKVFVVHDSLLKLQNIHPVFFKEKTAVITGLEDGVKLLKEPLPGAFDGMQVQVINN